MLGILMSDVCWAAFLRQTVGGRECAKAPRLFYFQWRAVGILADAHGLPRKTHMKVGVEKVSQDVCTATN